MTSETRIKARLATEGCLTLWRRKVHDLRKVVAGDYSPVDEKAIPQDDPTRLEKERERWRESMGMTDVLVTDFEGGTSNKLLQALRTLVQQSAYHFPEIEFEEAHELEAAVNSLYLKRRLGPKPHGCGAVAHMRRALWHYVIDGIGWVWTGVLDGKPTVSCVDTVDVAWDNSVPEPTDARWVAVRWQDTLGYWTQIYGEGPFSEILEKLGADGKEGRDRAMEKSVELLFYYDVDGPKGTHAVYVMGSGGPIGDAIEIVDNPHSMDSDGLQVPFLPLEPCYYLALPSVRNPIGIAELILPSQIALREDEQYMNAVVARGKPWLDIPEGSYEDDELQKLAEGELGEGIRRKSGGSPAAVAGGMEIPSSVLQRSQHNEQELYASSGANPYASGSKVSGIKYASEVNAIQGNASLVAGWIASDHADFWRRVVKKVLANAKRYDMVPLRLSLDGDDLTFGPQNPIGPYLRDDADPVVAEDSMAFAPRDKRIADANSLLTAALSVQAAFPNGVKEAYSKLLRAFDVRDVAAYLEAPPPVPMDAAAAAAAPGEGGMAPDAQAAASTA